MEACNGKVSGLVFSQSISLKLSLDIELGTLVEDLVMAMEHGVPLYL